MKQIFLLRLELQLIQFFQTEILKIGNFFYKPAILIVTWLTIYYNVMLNRILINMNICFYIKI